MRGSARVCPRGAHPALRRPDIVDLVKPDEAIREASADSLGGGLLKLEPDEDTSAAELAFELRFLGSLAVAQRFELMFQKSREMKELMESCGHRSAPAILKRA